MWEERVALFPLFEHRCLVLGDSLFMGIQIASSILSSKLSIQEGDGVLATPWHC